MSKRRKSVGCRLIEKDPSDTVFANSSMSEPTILSENELSVCSLDFDLISREMICLDRSLNYSAGGINIEIVSFSTKDGDISVSPNCEVPEAVSGASTDSLSKDTYTEKFDVVPECYSPETGDPCSTEDTHSEGEQEDPCSTEDNCEVPEAVSGASTDSLSKDTYPKKLVPECYSPEIGDPSSTEENCSEGEQEHPTPSCCEPEVLDNVIQWVDDQNPHLKDYHNSRYHLTDHNYTSFHLEDCDDSTVPIVQPLASVEDEVKNDAPLEMIANAKLKLSVPSLSEGDSDTVLVSKLSELSIEKAEENLKCDTCDSSHSSPVNALSEMEFSAQEGQCGVSDGESSTSSLCETVLNVDLGASNDSFNTNNGAVQTSDLDDITGGPDFEHFPISKTNSDFTPHLSEDNTKDLEYPSFFNKSSTAGESSECRNSIDPEVGIKQVFSEYNSSSGCATSFEEILHFQQDLKEKRNVVEQLYVKLHHNDEDDLDDENPISVNSETFSNLNIVSKLEKDCFGPSRINDPPPGLQIIKDEKMFSLFKQSDIVLQVPECSKRLSRLETLLIENPSLASNFLPFAIDHLRPSHVTNPNEFLTFLFKVMAVHSDYVTVDSCEDTIKRFLSTTCHNKVNWCPSVVDLYTVFLNYGIDITIQCPIENILKNLKDHVAPLRGSQVSNSPEWQYVAKNFCAVLNVLYAALINCCTYSTKELSQVIIFIMWISLDPKLLLSSTQIILQNCAAAALERISAENLDSELVYLSEEMCKLGHHKNFLKLIKEFPEFTERGCLLRKAACLTALRNCLKTSETFDNQVEEILHLLKIVHSKINHELSDFLQVDTIISLLDTFVCSSMDKIPVAKFKEMCSLLLRISSKIDDDSRYPEKYLTKEKLVRMRCAWVLHYPSHKLLDEEYSGEEESDVPDVCTQCCETELSPKPDGSSDVGPHKICDGKGSATDGQLGNVLKSSSASNFTNLVSTCDEPQKENKSESHLSNSPEMELSKSPVQSDHLLADDHAYSMAECDPLPQVMETDSTLMTDARLLPSNVIYGQASNRDQTLPMDYENENVSSSVPVTGLCDENIGVISNQSITIPNDLNSRMIPSHTSKQNDLTLDTDARPLPSIVVYGQTSTGDQTFPMDYENDNVPSSVPVTGLCDENVVSDQPTAIPSDLNSTMIPSHTSEQNDLILETDARPLPSILVYGQTSSGDQTLPMDYENYNVPSSVPVTGLCDENIGVVSNQSTAMPSDPNSRMAPSHTSEVDEGDDCIFIKEIQFVCLD